LKVSGIHFEPFQPIIVKLDSEEDKSEIALVALQLSEMLAFAPVLLISQYSTEEIDDIDSSKQCQLSLPVI
jgi:hypothetical protein